MITVRYTPGFAGGTSRFPQTPSTGPLARTGGFTAGKRA
jgi:hypothetical protein